MTIEIRQLIIRAVVEPQQQTQQSPNLMTEAVANHTDVAAAASLEWGHLKENELVARCTYAVLRQLARQKER